jgi:divalent metal cation (Fe/Co/Zn/Cd) transporter
MRWVGHELLVEADIRAHGDISLVAAHEIAEQAQHELLHRLPRLAGGTIHVNPAGADHHEVTAHHFPGGAVSP